MNSVIHIDSQRKTFVPSVHTNNGTTGVPRSISYGIDVHAGRESMWKAASGCGQTNAVCTRVSYLADILLGADKQLIVTPTKTFHPEKCYFFLSLRNIAVF
jgi:hypothetical protein